MNIKLMISEEERMNRSARASMSINCINQTKNGKTERQRPEGLAHNRGSIILLLLGRRGRRV